MKKNFEKVNLKKKKKKKDFFKKKKKEEKEEMAEEKKEYEEEADVTDWEGMEKRIKNLEDAVSDLKKQIGETGDVEEMAEEVSEPSDKPRTKTTKTTETIEFSVEDLKAENEKLKAELAASPADTPINTNKFSSEKTELSKKQYNKLSKQEKFLYNLYK